VSQPKWDELQTEVVAHLQAMLRLKTVNPPGDEILVARCLDGVCRAAGIGSRSHSSRRPVHGGERANVIPNDVRVTLNVRTLPGQRLQDAIDRLAALLRDEPVDIVVDSQPSG
jgi:hypothetical protein